MYQFSYAEVLDENPVERRRSEREAVDRSIQLLRIAEQAGLRSRETVEALSFLRQLWMFFLQELAQDSNELPKELRAKLISIGLWLLREAEDIRNEKSANFAGLIEISTMIGEGLQ